MKKILLTFIPLLFILSARAQLTDSARNSNDMVYVSVEHVPEFPGGISQFNRFLMKTVPSGNFQELVGRRRIC